MEKCFQNSLTSFTSKLIKRIREIRMRNFDYGYVKHIFRLHSNRIPYSIVTIITLFPMMFVWKCIQTVHAKGSIINSTPQRGAGRYIPPYERYDIVNSKFMSSYFLSSALSKSITRQHTEFDYMDIGFAN